MVAIIINCVVLCLPYYGASTLYNKIIDSMNNFFTICFTVEAIIKIVGFGFRYFKDKWNIFDFLIVVFSAVGIILEQVLQLEGF